MRETKLTLTEMLLEMAEDLTNDETTGSKLKEKIEKANALSKVAEQVVNLQDVAVRDLDVKIKAVQVAASVGLKYTPEGLDLAPLPPSQKQSVKSIPDKNKKYPDKGLTPEGLPYEW